MRRFIRLAILGSALCLALGATAARAAEPVKKYKVTMPVLGDGFHYYPIYIAQAAGFFAEEGIDSQIVDVDYEFFAGSDVTLVLKRKET